jgi:hypothetical protein
VEARNCASFALFYALTAYDQDPHGRFLTRT